VKASLVSKKAPEKSLKAPSKRGQDGPTPAIRWLCSMVMYIYASFSSIFSLLTFCVLCTAD
jgi:hypothetical protein